MRKVLLFTTLCFFIVLCIGNSALAIMYNQIANGDRVVYDDLNRLYWYPILTDFTDMTRDEQLAAIGDLVYAGSSDWRMATATETTVQKKSLSEMASVEVIPTSFANYGNVDPDPDNRTLSSPFLAYNVFPADFFTPTGSTEGAFWSGNTPGYMFNGRVAGWGWTNTGQGGFGGDLELLENSADDHFVAHSLMSDKPYGTTTYNYDLHFRDDQATSMGMGGIGAWVVTSSVPVPEPATMLLLGTGLVGLAGASRKKLFKK